MQIFLLRMKNDQVGNLADKPINVYANSVNPWICPILSMGIFLAVHPTTGDTGRQHLLTGGSQDSRFEQILIRFIGDDEDLHKNKISQIEGVDLNAWYLDDGTIKSSGNLDWDELKRIAAELEYERTAFIAFAKLTEIDLKKLEENSPKKTITSIIIWLVVSIVVTILFAEPVKAIIISASVAGLSYTIGFCGISLRKKRIQDQVNEFLNYNFKEESVKKILAKEDSAPEFLSPLYGQHSNTLQKEEEKAEEKKDKRGYKGNDGTSDFHIPHVWIGWTGLYCKYCNQKFSKEKESSECFDRMDLGTLFARYISYQGCQDLMGVNERFTILSVLSREYEFADLDSEELKRIAAELEYERKAFVSFLFTKPEMFLIEMIENRG
jgi:hypothetical protein